MENYRFQLNKPALGVMHSENDHPIAALIDYREGLKVEAKRVDRIIEYLSINSERVSIKPGINSVVISGEQVILSKLVEIELSE
jgi:hypothetical protein